MVKTYAIIQQLATKQDLSAIASEVAGGAQSLPRRASRLSSTKPLNTEALAVNLATVDANETSELSTQAPRKQSQLAKETVMPPPPPAVAQAAISPASMDDGNEAPIAPRSLGEIDAVEEHHVHNRQLNPDFEATTGPRGYSALGMFGFPPPAHAETIDSSSGAHDPAPSVLPQEKQTIDQNAKSPQISLSPPTGESLSTSHIATRLWSSDTGVDDTAEVTVESHSQPEMGAMFVSAPAEPWRYGQMALAYRNPLGSIEPPSGTRDLTNKGLGLPPEDLPTTTPVWVSILHVEPLTFVADSAAGKGSARKGPGEQARFLSDRQELCE